MSAEEVERETQRLNKLLEKKSTQKFEERRKEVLQQAQGERLPKKEETKVDEEVNAKPVVTKGGWREDQLRRERELEERDLEERRRRLEKAKQVVAERNVSNLEESERLEQQDFENKMQGKVVGTDTESQRLEKVLEKSMKGTWENPAIVNRPNTKYQPQMSAEEEMNMLRARRKEMEEKLRREGKL